MTFEELTAREAIRDTLAIASRAGDHLMIEEYIGCFAADGVLEYGTTMRHAGHAELRVWLEKAKAHADKRGLIRHNVTSTQITLTGPASAEVQSYYQVFSDIGPDHFGWYQDSLAPHRDRWLLSRRIVGVDWISDLSRINRVRGRTGDQSAIGAPERR